MKEIEQMGGAGAKELGRQFDKLKIHFTENTARPGRQSAATGDEHQASFPERFQCLVIGSRLVYLLVFAVLLATEVFDFGLDL